jgi:hypothetical protein
MVMNPYRNPALINGFACPLCGSTAYKHLETLRPDGSIRQTTVYHCGGCSVLFKDPDKITAQKKVEGVARPAYPPVPENEYKR